MWNDCHNNYFFDAPRIIWQLSVPVMTSYGVVHRQTGCEMYTRNFGCSWNHTQKGSDSCFYGLDLRSPEPKPDKVVKGGG